uniref:Testis-specific Y-encoded protein 1-like n=1 Tax=Bos mutus grunniens TaxID=30521 RepID=A0A8B9WRT2_BOSMU
MEKSIQPLGAPVYHLDTQGELSVIEGPVGHRSVLRMFQLLVEDIMEEVEVLADEKQQQGSSQDLDEKILEDQGQQWPGGLNELLALDALQALATMQVELSSDHEKNCRRRKCDLAQRSAIIQGIPGFWVKVIMNHPQVSVIISDQDKDFLSYLINLQASASHPWSHSKLIFSFRYNPYFLNTVIIKEYYLDITGKTAHHSTPVHWLWDFEQRGPSCRLVTRNLNFLNWLSGHNCPESNRIVEVD